VTTFFRDAEAFDALKIQVLPHLFDGKSTGTHRVAISNRRLVALDDSRVTFKWKDYRIEGPDRYKLMTATRGANARTPRPRPLGARPRRIGARKDGDHEREQKPIPYRCCREVTASAAHLIYW